MTTTRIVTSAAFIAAFALAVPAHAGQHRGGGGRDGGSSRGAGASRGGVRGGGGASRGSVRSYPVYRDGGGVRGGIRVAPRFGSSRGFIRSGFYRPYYAFRPRLSLGFGLWAGYPVAYPYYSDYPYGYGAPYQSDPYAYGGYNNGASSSSYAYEVQPYGRSAQRPAYPESDDRFDNDEQQGNDDQPGDFEPRGQYPSQQPSASGVQRRGDDRSAAGGISFEITPDAAAVFVDGTYVGTAGTFGPSSQPLGLTTGRHHVEIRASGYRSMTFDADVTPGQVIPYQGTLQRN